MLSQIGAENSRSAFGRGETWAQIAPSPGPTKSAMPLWHTGCINPGDLMVPTLQKPAECSDVSVIAAPERRESAHTCSDRVRASREPASGDWTRHFTPLRLALLIGFFLFIQYPEVILGSHSFFDRDFGLFTSPLAHFTRESFWRGEVPLWNPLSHCGIPFLAQWNTTVLYPPSLLYMLLPLPWSLNIFCLGHLVFAGLAMYWLAYRWTNDRFAASLAGLAYALNGLSFNALMWTSISAALAWLPLVVLFAQRAWREGGKWIIQAAFAGAMQMLSGAPEIILMTWLLVGSLWILETWSGRDKGLKSAGRLSSVGVLVCGLAAVQLLPFMELLSHSDRHSGQSNTAWSMPAWGWANFIVPLFHCSRTILGGYIQAGQQWTSSYYLGIGVLALGGVALAKARQARVYWLAGVALSGMVLALGENCFLYSALARIFPPIGLARYPVKFVALTSFALPLLAAFAVTWVRQHAPTRSLEIRKSLLYATVCLIALSLSILAISYFRPYPEETWSVTLWNGLQRIVFVVSIAGAVLLLCKPIAPSKRALLGLLVLMLIGLDAVTHTARQNATVPIRGYGPMNLGLNSIPRAGKSRAMVSPQMEAFLSHASTPNALDCYIGARHSLYLDCNLLDSIPCVGGFYPLNLSKETEVRALFSSGTNFPSGLADFLGVAQISSSEQLWQWSPRNSFLPWATAGQQPIFADGATTLANMANAGFDPRRVLYLPLSARQEVIATNACEAEVLSSEFSTREAVIQVKSPKPSWVVIAQAFYPAWKAYVDGKPTKILPANHAFQAVEVPAGQHRVELRYEDRAFEAGAVGSGLTLAGCLGGWVLIRPRKRRG